VAGRFVQVAGYQSNKGVLHAFLVNVPEPEFAFSARVVPHAAVAGKDQTWDVVTSVKNKGKQPIRNVRFTVRCYQLQSPNDFSKDFTVASISPGDTVTVKTDFSMFNFQFIGRTSIPKCELKLQGFEW
jgi:hypothetical protein